MGDSVGAGCPKKPRTAQCKKIGLPEDKGSLKPRRGRAARAGVPAEGRGAQAGQPTPAVAHGVHTDPLGGCGVPWQHKHHRSDSLSSPGQALPQAMGWLV